MTYVIRSAVRDDADAIAKVHVAAWQDAYRDIVPNDFLTSLSVKQRADRWREIITFNQARDANTLFVVANNKEICGFIACGPARDHDFPGHGEIFAIYILPGQQKQGHGGKLFEASKQFLIRKGFRRAYVWSLEQNTLAHKAYEKWGARRAVERIKEVEIGGINLREIVHSWTW